MRIATLALAITLTLTACGKGGGDTLTDPRDKKNYKTVKIGEQVWIAENLNYEADGSKCYNDSTAYCDKYGRLYNWETAMKACPKGWHLPNDKDWNVLMKFVNPSCSDNSHCDGAGTKLKATTGWNSRDGKSGNGTDDYGFAALPGGNGISYGSFYDVGGSGFWWSASEDNADRAYGRDMYYGYEVVGRGNGSKSNYLFSVRCLQD